MNFCSQCGSGSIGLQVPVGDNRERYVCTDCSEIFYHNPKMVVGCLIEHGTQVLLCKRAIEPRVGLWTLPAGFMENAETAAEGAQREAHEEALAKTDVFGLYAQFSIAHIDQVYLIYRARLTSAETIGAGEESLAVGLFEEHQIPWEELAFPVMRKTLELYYEDRRDGRFRAHSGDIVVNPEDRARPVINMISTD
ncbi:MAG: NUDIX hydrolase [Pseudomonadota bacterium]